MTAGQYVLNVDCGACMRVAGSTACDMCSMIENAERAAGNPPSAQLVKVAEVDGDN